MNLRIPKNEGFALAEIVVALVFVTLAITLVSGLGQQVMQLARSSRQTAAIVELRSKSNSITRNLDSWLGKMRSTANSGAIYSACIPDPSAVSSVFSCPEVDATILANDPELKSIAGTQLHASTVPIVDMMGDKIAGTVDDPVFFDLDGKACTTNACPLKSLGYMLRSNPDTNSSPGSVRFVVKLQPQNRAVTRTH